MLDWNGNGKIDPTDVGISMAALEEGDEHTGEKKKPGCLVSALTVVFAIALLFLIL